MSNTTGHKDREATSSTESTREHREHAAPSSCVRAQACSFGANAHGSVQRGDAKRQRIDACVALSTLDRCEAAGTRQRAVGLPPRSVQVCASRRRMQQASKATSGSKVGAEKAADEEDSFLRSQGGSKHHVQHLAEAGGLVEFSGSSSVEAVKEV